MNSHPHSDFFRHLPRVLAIGVDLSMTTADLFTIVMVAKMGIRDLWFWKPIPVKLLLGS
jgi:hypothetical protein